MSDKQEQKPANVGDGQAQGRGRPPKYKAIYAQQAYKLCLLGADDSALANFFEVAESTLNRWKLAHPEFRESLNAGKIQADAKVAESLYQRATGYSHPEEKIFCYEGEIIRAATIRHYPPDTTACIFWLKNRQPKLWRDKVEVKQEVDVRVIPWDEIREISKQALEQAEDEHQRMIVGRAERLGLKTDYSDDET
jgi:hypothetical protein